MVGLARRQERPGGRSCTTIASRLHLSEKTVRNNISALLLKVGAPDRAAPVVAARDAGLGAR